MREKKKVVNAPEEAEAREALRDYVNTSSKLKEIEAKQELEINKVREKYKGKVTDLQDKKASCFELVQAYGEANKEDLFVKKKSIDWSFGIFGFRTGTPKVDKKRGITWPAALDLIREMDDQFIRTKEEVDKDKIIASRDDIQLMGKFAKIGITVVQDETFFIEAKEEELVNA